MFFFTHEWINQFLIPVPSPSKENIPLLLVVKNRPSDNQISSYDFLKIHKFGIRPGLQIAFPEKIPSTTHGKKQPFDSQLNCNSFSIPLRHSHHFSLQDTRRRNTPSLLVQFQPPFDNLKNAISLKMHIQL